MPHESWTIRIDDILDATAAVQGFIEGFDLEAFRQDRRTRDAVLHNLEVIWRTITKDLPALPPLLRPLLKDNGLDKDLLSPRRTRDGEP